MKRLFVLFLLVVPAFVQQTGGRGSGGAPGHPGGGVDPNTCDLKTVQEGIYCEKCDKILEKEDVLDREFCKRCNKGKEKKERTKAAKVKVCFKKFCECDYHGKTFSSLCCGKGKVASSKSLIEFKCEGCDAAAYNDASIQHDNERHKTNKSKKIIRRCKKSGEFPHVNESAQTKKR